MDMLETVTTRASQPLPSQSDAERPDSFSSSDSAHSSTSRPRKAVRSAKRSGSAAAQVIEREQSSSTWRCESSSSMHTSSAPLQGPVTYTPTTHRISKAKKGKRVHACEFPGCNKIFTRAEHRRRHELNHSPEASYPCDRAGCRKAFHRQDLLQRHQERHELESHSEGAAVVHRRLPSDHSNPSLGPSLLSSAPLSSPPMLPAQATHNGLSIPSLLHPSSGDGQSHDQHASGFDFVPRTPFPMYSSSISGSDDFIYSSPQSSSHSPLSDQYGFPHRNSVSSSASSVVDFVPPHCTSPLIHPGASGWALGGIPPSCASLEDEMAAFPSALPYPYPSPSWPALNALPFGSESWHPARELSKAPTTVDWPCPSL